MLKKRIKENLRITEISHGLTILWYMSENATCSVRFLLVYSIEYSLLIQYNWQIQEFTIWSHNIHHLHLKTDIIKQRNLTLSSKWTFYNVSGILIRHYFVKCKTVQKKLWDSMNECKFLFYVGTTSSIRSFLIAICLYIYVIFRILLSDHPFFVPWPLPCLWTSLFLIRKEE